MTPRLPERLGDWTTVLDALSAFDPGELGDDSPRAMDLVTTAIRARIRGLDEDEARSLLQADCDLFEEWMIQPEADTSPAGYIHGSLLGTLMWADFDELAR